MGPLLLLLFLLTLGYLAYFGLPGSRKSDALALGRKITAGYVLISSALIALLILLHTALLRADVHRLVRHVEFRGVAVTVRSITGDTSNVQITGDPIEGGSVVARSFRWFALPSGTTIDLRPDKSEGRKIESYIAEAHRCPEVVRLNRVCVNDVVGGWIPAGQSSQFDISDSTRPKANRFEFSIAAKDGQVSVNDPLDGSSTHAAP